MPGNPIKIRFLKIRKNQGNRNRDVVKFSKKIPNHKLNVWSKFQVSRFNNAEVMPIFVKANMHILIQYSPQ